jgi:hypothetical protein
MSQGCLSFMGDGRCALLPAHTVDRWYGHQTGIATVQSLRENEGLPCVTIFAVRFLSG